MENATKALLIAGGVLIAIVMITIGIYLYSLYSNQTKQYNEIITATEIQKFNSNFEIYLGKKDITAQEIATAINKAEEYSDNVVIFLDGRQINFRSTLPENFIKINYNVLFSCNISNTNPIYDEYGRITTIKFTTNG